jgi:hypothetical protein
MPDERVAGHPFVGVNTRESVLGVADMTSRVDSGFNFELLIPDGSPTGPRQVPDRSPTAFSIPFDHVPLTSHSITRILVYSDTAEHQSIRASCVDMLYTCCGYEGRCSNTSECTIAGHVILNYLDLIQVTYDRNYDFFPLSIRESIGLRNSVVVLTTRYVVSPSTAAAASRKTVYSSCSQHDNRVSTLNSLID